MSLYETLLFLHVLAAFALVAALVVFLYAILAGLGVERPSEALAVFRTARGADLMIVLGSLGTLVFGIALAIERDEYEVWDGWIIGAIVLWAIAGGLGGRTGKIFNGARDRAKALVAEGNDAPNPELQATLRSRSGLWLHLATIVVTVLLLADMIWKPGA